MGIRLAGLLLALWMVAGPLTSVSAATSVGAVLGGSIACDPTVDTCGKFPGSASILCNGTGVILDCPQFFAPDPTGTGPRFFGITNRTNPPRVITSTDGGLTWGLVPTQPYVAALDAFGAGIAVSSTGTIIVPANQGANNCIIRVSTDQGTSWTTAFTDVGATDNCGILFGNPTGNIARCAQSAGYCAVLNPTGAGAFNLITYFSNDNGTSWTKGGVSDSVVSGDQELQIKIDGSGSSGVVGYAQISNGNGPVNKSGDLFREGTGFAWNASRCWGALLQSGSRQICGPDNSGGVNNNLYNHYTVGGGITTFINTFTLSDAPVFSQSPDFHVEGFSNSIGYLMGRNAAATRVNIYVTTTTWTSAALIAQLNPATALIAGACRGESHKFGSKIYFTCGGTASQAFFAVIQ